MTSKNWIDDATRNRGALRRKAERTPGAITKRDTIRVSWLRQQAKRNDKTGQQARLALTLRKMRSK